MTWKCKPDICVNQYFKLQHSKIIFLESFGPILRMDLGCRECQWKVQPTYGVRVAEELFSWVLVLNELKHFHVTLEVVQQQELC